MMAELIPVAGNDDDRVWPKRGARYPVLLAVGLHGHALVDAPPEVLNYLSEMGCGVDDLFQGLPDDPGIYRGEAIFGWTSGDGWEREADSWFDFENGRLVEAQS